MRYAGKGLSTMPGPGEHSVKGGLLLFLQEAAVTLGRKGVGVRLEKIGQIMEGRADIGRSYSPPWGGRQLTLLPAVVCMVRRG